MTVAAIDGQVIVILVVAVLGFLNWLGNKLKEASQPTPPSVPRTTADTPRREVAADSEEERMRRFMEALGLPSGETPIPRSPIRPTPAPRPVVVTAPPPLPAVPRPRVNPPPPEPRSFDELPAPSLPAAQISVPELVTPEVHEYQTVSSRVSATHGREAATLVLAQAVSPGAPLRDFIRASLASPRQLRSAFVLREVLGPPVALRG